MIEMRGSIMAPSMQSIPARRAASATSIARGGGTNLPSTMRFLQTMYAGMKRTPTATPTPAEMPILMGTLRFLTSADDLMPFMSMKRVMMATQKATRSG